MEQPGYQSQDQAPYDLDFGYGPKQAAAAAAVQAQQLPLGELGPVVQANGNNAAGDGDGFAASAVLEPVNGRHRHKPPKYDYGDDDEDDDEEDDEDDLGPETNVDAVDDAPDDFGKLEQAAGVHSYPDEFLLNTSMSKRESEAYAMQDNSKRPRNELIHDADNVGDSEDSEDEWNYYRPDEENAKDEKEEQEGSSAGGNAPAKDPALVEKPDPTEGEKEPCSPKPSDDGHPDDDAEDHHQPLLQEQQPASAGSSSSPQQQQQQQSAVDPELDADADDVTAEFDELHQNEGTKDSQFELKEADAEAETTTIPEEDLPFDKDQLELDQEQPEELQNLDESFRENEEDMDSHLNPNAEEFVPVTNTSPSIPQHITQMGSDLIAGSPLKQSQRALQTRSIPSEEEFKEEVSHRPSDIDDTNIGDFSNGDLSPQKSLLGGGFDDSKQNTVLFDNSEISSTRAEFGDDTTANFSTTSELYRTGNDSSFTGSDFDYTNNPMATSMTPSDFKTAFEQTPDLNKVHELSDDDMFADNMQNGGLKEKSDAMSVEEDDLGKDKIELDLENIVPQQEQNLEMFSAIIEEKEDPDNKDLFMNIRNKENSSDFELSDKVENVSNDSHAYANSNPFSIGYAPGFDNDIQNLADNLEKVTLQDATLLPVQPIFDNDNLLLPEKPEMQKEIPSEVVMLNPLDLNVGASSVEQKNDEPVLVSPIQDPEVMSSKFAEEEDLLSSSFNPQPTEQEEYSRTECVEEVLKPAVPEYSSEVVPEYSNEVASKLDYSDDVEPKYYNEEVPEYSNKITSEYEVSQGVDEKAIFSESLKEFTGLEEQLSSKTEPMDTEPESLFLKENLVDEQKDVEEITPTPVSSESKEELISISNEPNEILSNEIIEKETVAPVNEEPITKEDSAAVSTAEAAVTSAAVIAGTAAAVAAASTAAKPTKSTTTAAKTAKPSTSKPGTKSTTPTSTKTGVTTKTTSAAATKKPLAPSAAPRTKPATTTAATKSAPGTVSKTTGAPKTNTVSKTTTSTASKPAPRVSAVSSTPKPKPSSVTSKISSTSTDKKATANGEAKPLSAVGKSAPASRTAAAKTASASTASKPGLVSKTSSTTTRTSLGGASSTASKSRPASAAATKLTAKQSPNVTSSTNSTAAARPKTAPASTTKPKVGTVAKSPMIDKQIKETANKQISSARTSLAPTTTKTRQSLAPSNASTTTKRTSLAPKTPAANAAAASPTKKPAPISKTNLKNVPSKVNSKVTSTTKSSTVTSTATAKPVQNGVCEIKETVITTNTTTNTTVTTNIEEDLPKKDISPIEQQTDNQLITAE